MDTKPMSVPMLMRSWWILALRGLVALLCGALALALPGVTTLTLVVLFAAYALVAGGASVAGALRNRRHAKDWWLLLVLGVVSLGAGVLALLQPAVALLALVIVMGANALVTGVLDLALAVRMRRQLHGAEWVLALGGIAALLFGAIVLVMPDAGVFALVGLFGLYAMVSGLLYLALAYRVFMRQRRTSKFSRRGPELDRRQGDRRMVPVR